MNADLARRLREGRWVQPTSAAGVLGIGAAAFLLSYDAAADGLGSVTKRAGFSSWATDHAAIYGLLLYLVLTAYLVALIRSRGLPTRARRRSRRSTRVK